MDRIMGEAFLGDGLLTLDYQATFCPMTRYDREQSRAAIPRTDNTAQQEIQRLDLTHVLVSKAIGDVIYKAPIDETKPLRILDVGTGTGICTTPLSSELRIMGEIKKC